MRITWYTDVKMLSVIQSQSLVGDDRGKIFLSPEGSTAIFGDTRISLLWSV